VTRKGEIMRRDDCLLCFYFSKSKNFQVTYIS